MLWNSTLESGIPIVDEQHIELFKQADILIDPNHKDRIPETLKFLEKYVHKHFQTEQMMHQNTHYPKAAPHKVLHDKFIASFEDLKHQYETEGNKLTVVMAINKLVISWLKDHIMAHDKEFATFHKAHKGH